ncbi:multidrug resistance protein fnx1 [Colletotrichum salicis]|uniref:Multidrug resistance protein fnx1 n=1 Tax=Colletotrichum salicis TaxID=1209931 RepID=A0A135SE99_9PEZI|nr:multidrug resistance protein fnx1 [Colletotrichum salicis]
MDSPFGIVLHGGASESWIGDDVSYATTKAFLKNLVEKAEERLRAGSRAIDVATEVVAELEDFPEFNAGKGAAVNRDGVHEVRIRLSHNTANIKLIINNLKLEAGIINGKTATYRAAACLQKTKNPIKLGRAMLDSVDTTMPVFIVGEGADQLACRLGLDMVDNSFFTTQRRMDYWRKNKTEVLEHGTVGAVVLDSHGHLAAANSTGGMMFKQAGRLGDTAILGAGLYADQQIAVACSGGGEAILTSMLASRVANLYHSGLKLETAVDKAMWDASGLCPSLSCGVIAITTDGMRTEQCNSRLFTIGSSGSTYGFKYGLIGCTMPVTAALCCYEDALVRIGVSKHPTRQYQLTFCLKEASLITMDRKQVEDLFESLRRASKALLSLGGTDKVAMMTFAGGKGGHLFAIRGTGSMSPTLNDSKQSGNPPFRAHIEIEKTAKALLQVGDFYKLPVPRSYSEFLLASAVEFRAIIAGLWGALSRGLRVALQTPLHWVIDADSFPDDLILLCFTHTILVSNFVTAVDSGLSSSSHLAIASHFDKTKVSTWPVNAFLVCSITVQPLYATLSNCIGRRIIYTSTAFLFLVGSCLAAFTTSWTGLILARGVCGLAVAGLMTMGSIVLTDIVGLKNRGHYQSLNYINYGAGSALGSISGGAIVEYFGWSYVYRLQLPFCLLSAVMVYLWIPSNIENSYREPLSQGKICLTNLLQTYDWRGSLLLMISLLCLVFVLGTGGNVLPWTNPLILTASALFGVVFYVLLRVEAKAPYPVLPPLMIQFPYRNIMGSALMFSMINYCVMYNTPFFFQAVRLESAGEASAHVVIPSIAFTAMSAVAGTTIAKLRTPRPTLRVSQVLLLVGALGLVAMATALPATKASNSLYSLCLIMPSLGVGMMAPSALLTLLSLGGQHDHAAMNGGFIMMRSLGVFIATSLSTTIIQNVSQVVLKTMSLDEETAEKVEATRLNIDNLRDLSGDMQSKVMQAYQLGFVVLFSVLLVCSMGIVLAFSWVPEGRLDRLSNRAEDSDAVVEMVDHLDDEETDDGL